VSLDSLHPYGYSGGGITHIWPHMLEPLMQMESQSRDQGDVCRSD
jgi:hypothetical protein